MTSTHRLLFPSLILMAALAAGCTAPPPSAPAPTPIPTMAPVAAADPTLAPTVTVMDHSDTSAMQGATLHFALESGLAEGRMVFIGRSSGIEGAVNPTLRANPGDTVEITLTSGEGAGHDLAIPDLGAASARVQGKGNSATFSFRVEKEGSFAYFCTVPGHRAAGMEGLFVVGAGAESSVASAVSVVRDPTDLPAPIGARAVQAVRLDLETVELVARLADGASYSFWTFNGKVPGPFVRVRQGDTVEVHLKNASTSTMVHSVDFHAVTGPGGGAVATQTQPGGETTFTFKALNAGLFVYHCATPMVAHHIANGMYGLILVEPPGGLPKVDREFYVMQGDFYTAEPFGSQGLLTFSTKKLLDETPEYYVFNGAVGGLTQEHPLKANVGETVRIFFGVGGPNKTSSFHVIGEILDRVYDQASLTSPPLTDVQTTLVPPGGATMVELKLQVPGRFLLVDHALSRMERGLMGYLLVEGPEAPDIFHGTPTGGSGH
jgi:nitrite reductase (NO-forming)